MVLCSLILARSTKESSLLNSVSVVAHLALIVFVFCAGALRVRACGICIQDLDTSAGQ